MEKIFSGKTLDDAKEAAYNYFSEQNVDRGSVKIEIIEQPVKKLFGTKGEYRIKATADNDTADSGVLDIIADIKESGAVKQEKTSDNGDFSHIIGYISKILNALGAEDYKIEIREKPDLVILDIVGDNLGIVIGRRGETLDSLQYLSILANGSKGRDYTRIAVDCNGYREKRRETLESLAKRTASKVIKQGRRMTLEPMNPYERRIIHSAVSEIEGVYSNSIGEEPYRKVVISATVPKHGNSGNYSGNRAKRDDAPAPRSYKQSSGFSTSFEREYKRNTDIEISEDTAKFEKDASLYGKIEL